VVEACNKRCPLETMRAANELAPFSEQERRRGGVTGVDTNIKASDSAGEPVRA